MFKGLSDYGDRVYRGDSEEDYINLSEGKGWFDQELVNFHSTRKWRFMKKRVILDFTVNYT